MQIGPMDHSAEITGSYEGNKNVTPSDETPSNERSLPKTKVKDQLSNTELLAKDMRTQQKQLAALKGAGLTFTGVAIACLCIPLAWPGAIAAGILALATAVQHYRTKNAFKLFAKEFLHEVAKTSLSQLCPHATITPKAEKDYGQLFKEFTNKREQIKEQIKDHENKIRNLAANIGAMLDGTLNDLENKLARLKSGLENAEVECGKWLSGLDESLSKTNKQDAQEKIIMKGFQKMNRILHNVPTDKF